MTPLHCLWAKSNNRTCGQFECGMTWFCFCFDVVRFYVQCDCYSIVCWRGGGGGGSFKIRHPRSREWKNFGLRWTGGGEDS